MIYCGNLNIDPQVGKCGPQGFVKHFGPVSALLMSRFERFSLAKLCSCLTVPQACLCVKVPSMLKCILGLLLGEIFQQDNASS